MSDDMTAGPEMGATPAQWAEMTAFMVLHREVMDVRLLGDRIGYGNLMHRAQEQWRASLAARGGFVGGELVVGPCAAETVPCGCVTPHQCDWCCGASWLTKRCKEAKDRHG